MSKSSVRKPPTEENDYYTKVDEQLEKLTPSKELLAHYKEKILQLDSDYLELIKKIDKCHVLCNSSFQLEQDLKLRNSQVSKLQQTVSDLQVFIQQEREQVLRLSTENDRLQFHVAEDRKKIEFLLSLSHMTENEITYLSKKIVPRLHCPHSRSSDKTKDVPLLHSDTLTESADANSKVLRTQLEEHMQLHHDQVHTLIKDREINMKERASVEKTLQDHITLLSNRLKKTQEELCQVTKELVCVKKEHSNKEIEWNEEKNTMLHSLKLCQERLGERYPPALGFGVSGSGHGKRLRHSQQLCAQVDVLKDELKQRDGLVSMYQEQCIQLNEETMKCKEEMENNKQKFRDQTQKLAGQVTYLKNKYKDLDHRRRLEAEGFCNDIKILRGRLQNMEKIVRNFSSKQGSVHTSHPTPNDLLSIANRTNAKAQQLVRELKDIKKTAKEIEKWN
ncbi:coiled-coil domain-containing protein 77-like [Periplaneta americana]|uniref:coiled-coil domain-containing protein 77-like n=1 Tax=Periplaneta americana TaxID=6978 RepID=UPI0037E8B758